MQIPTIDFVRHRKVFGAASMLMMVVSVIALFVWGIPLGLDFSGGVLLELHFLQAPDLEQIRSLLADSGIKDAVVQFFGTSNDVVIRLPSADVGADDLGRKSIAAIQQVYTSIDVRRIEFVGAQVGSELLEQGGMGVLVAIAVMLMYVAFRFQFKFAAGSVVALFHDVLLILLVFSVLQFDFDLTVLAALMTTVGYSLNDSLVISDRIREIIRTRTRDNLEESINISLNAVIGRTINTSLTTLLVSVTLMLVGGESVFSFAFGLTIGVIVGTYSSIYVLCNVLFWLNLKRSDLVVAEANNENKAVV